MQIESVYLFFFGIFGLAPIKVKPSSKNSRIRIKFINSRIGYLYNICLIITTLGISYSYSANTLYRKAPTDSPLLFILRIAVRIARILTVFIIWINSCWKQSKMVKILNNLTRISAQIVKISINDNQNIVPKKHIVFYLLVAMEIMFAIANFCTNYFSNNEINIRFLTNFFDSVFCWLILQYAIILGIIKIKCEEIHSKLSELADIRFGFLRYSFVNVREDYYNTTSLKVSTIRRIHAQLLGLCDDVSELYGVPILYSLTYASGVIIYYSYYAILHGVVFPQEKSLVYSMDAAVPLLRIIFAVSVLCIMANNATAQMKKSSDIIFHILEVCAFNRKVQKELEVFALEVSHREVHFQACDIFSIDCGLLRSIFSVTVTYLILLLQSIISKKEEVK